MFWLQNIVMVEQYSRLSVLEVKCTQSPLHLIDPVRRVSGSAEEKRRLAGRLAEERHRGVTVL